MKRGMGKKYEHMGLGFGTGADHLFSSRKTGLRMYNCDRALLHGRITGTRETLDCHFLGIFKEDERHEDLLYALPPSRSSEEIVCCAFLSTVPDRPLGLDLSRVGCGYLPGSSGTPRV